MAEEFVNPEADLLEPQPTLEPDAEQEAFRAELCCFANHRDASLDQPDPLQAISGLVTADLAQMLAYVTRAINQHLRDTPCSLAEIEHLRPAIDLQIRLAKQVVQTGQFAVRQAKQN